MSRSLNDGVEQGSTTGAIARLGVGADFRIVPGFALHPELTLLRGFGGENTIDYIAGIGLVFGAMPSYDDVGGGPPPEYDPPPPGGPPPSDEPAPTTEPIPPPAM